MRKTFCYEPTCDLASCQLDAYLSLSWVYGNPMEPQRPESAQKLKLDRVLVHPGIKSKLKKKKMEFGFGLKRKEG